MKVSDFLKKIATIRDAEIRIVFRADKSDKDSDVKILYEDTTEEAADQIIKRAAEYTLQEVEFFENVVIISAIKTAKRTQKQTPKQREGQKQAIADELKRLDQAVAVLIETIVGPFRRSGQREEKKRARIVAALHNAKAAVRRILTRIFGRGGRNENRID